MNATQDRPITCLNPEARNSRLYWLTESGIECQKQLCRDLHVPHEKCDLSGVNWVLFGWVCFSHRSIVIRMLNEPMQPAEIKRQIRIQRPNTKISANNIRDVIKLFLVESIVQPVKIRKKAHPRYELTDLGRQLKHLLIQAESIK